ncbi:MAG: ankyrin repeat domain-containing protein [Acidimicrobiales bacterium]
MLPGARRPRRPAGGAGRPADALDAAALGDVDRLRTLLDEAPDAATAEAADGFTALHLAAWFGRPRCAELLLARGADPERVAGNGTELRPLHSAPRRARR